MFNWEFIQFTKFWARTRIDSLWALLNLIISKMIKLTGFKILRPFKKFLEDNNYYADHPVFMQGSYDFHYRGIFRKYQKWQKIRVENPRVTLNNYSDGASSHTDKGSMQILCDMFGHSNIISRRTKVFLRESQLESSEYTIWSPSSPDLNVCDYWGMVYRS